MKRPVFQTSSRPFVPIGHSYNSCPNRLADCTSANSGVTQSRHQNIGIPTPSALTEPPIKRVRRDREVQQIIARLRDNMHRSMGSFSLQVWVYRRCPAPRPNFLNLLKEKLQVFSSLKHLKVRPHLASFVRKPCLLQRQLPSQTPLVHILLSPPELHPV